jgi:hypothetical protein
MMKPLVEVEPGEVARDFGGVSGRALREPLVIPVDGDRRVVMLSEKEYDRLKRRDRVAIRIEDLPQEFIEALMATEPTPDSAQFDHEVEDVPAS